MDNRIIALKMHEQHFLMPGMKVMRVPGGLLYITIVDVVGEKSDAVAVCTTFVQFVGFKHDN